MGIYDRMEPPAPAPGNEPPRHPGGGIYGRTPQLGPPEPPRPPVGNTAFGELKADNPTFTEWIKRKGQDILMGMGMKPYDARHFSSGVTDIAGFTPMGAVFSAGDLAHSVPQIGTGPRGWLGIPFHDIATSALDAVGAAPGYQMAKRAVRGLPQMIPALKPPPNIRHTDLDRGFVTPSTPELVGRGPAHGEPLGTAQQHYDAIRNAPVALHPAAGADIAQQMINHIQSPPHYFNLASARGVYETIHDNLRAWRGKGGPITPADLDTLRGQLRALPDAEGVAGRQAAGVIDRYLSNPPAHRVASGRPQDLAQLRADIAAAGGDYRAGQTARTVENQIDYAGTRAGPSNMRNLGTQTQSKMAGLSSPTSSALEFAAPTERAAVEEVARTGGLHTGTGTGALDISAPTGRRLETMASALDRASAPLLGGSPLGGLGGYFGGPHIGIDATTAALTAGGIPAAVGGAGMLGGNALRRAASGRTVEAAESAADLIRRNSPEFQSRLAAAGPPVDDPRAVLRDAIAYATLGRPSTEVGQDYWNKEFVPYENRAPLRLTVRPEDKTQE